MAWTAATTFVHIMLASRHAVTMRDEQVVVNYNTSAAPAEEVADQIKASGGDALVIGADVSKPEGVDK